MGNYNKATNAGLIINTLFYLVILALSLAITIYVAIEGNPFGRNSDRTDTVVFWLALVSTILLFIFGIIHIFYIWTHNKHKKEAQLEAIKKYCPENANALIAESSEAGEGETPLPPAGVAAGQGKLSGKPMGSPSKMDKCLEKYLPTVNVANFDDNCKNQLIQKIYDCDEDCPKLGEYMCQNRGKIVDAYKELYPGRVQRIKQGVSNVKKYIQKKNVKVPKKYKDAYGRIHTLLQPATQTQLITETTAEDGSITQVAEPIESSTETQIVQSGDQSIIENDNIPSDAVPLALTSSIPAQSAQLTAPQPQLQLTAPLSSPQTNQLQLTAPQQLQIAAPPSQIPSYNVTSTSPSSGKMVTFSPSV